MYHSSWNFMEKFCIICGKLRREFLGFRGYCTGFTENCPDSQRIVRYVIKVWSYFRPMDVHFGWFDGNS